jgi:di/tricarboxylate transporter
LNILLNHEAPVSRYRLFSTERIPIEVVAILLVMALVLTNTLTPTEAFAGFSSPAI